MRPSTITMLPTSTCTLLCTALSLRHLLCCGSNQVFPSHFGGAGAVVRQLRFAIGGAER